MSERRRAADTDSALHLVLDDATVERLRRAAERSGVEVEQLMVQIIHQASWHLDDVLVDPGEP